MHNVVTRKRQFFPGRKVYNVVAFVFQRQVENMCREEFMLYCTSVVETKREMMKVIVLDINVSCIITAVLLITNKVL
jgi:hypothetical protein